MAGVLFGLAMLRTGIFSRPTGWLAIVANVVGLGLYVPRAGIYVWVFSVLLLELWYVLLARRLYRLGRASGVGASTPRPDPVDDDA